MCCDLRTIARKIAIETVRKDENHGIAFPRKYRLRSVISELV